MNYSRSAWVVLFVLGLAFIAQAIYYFPLLPAHVASHFDQLGRPNAWVTPGGLVTFSLVIFVLLSGFFIALGRLLPRIPDFINIPNKQYWLSPGRQQETVAYMQVWLRWYTCLTLLLLLTVFELVYRTNLSGRPHLSQVFPWALGIYMIGVAVFILILLRRFRTPSDIVQSNHV